MSTYNDCSDDLRNLPIKPKPQRTWKALAEGIRMKATATPSNDVGFNDTFSDEQRNMQRAAVAIISNWGNEKLAAFLILHDECNK